jgi:hypothetical protein
MNELAIIKLKSIVSKIEAIELKKVIYNELSSEEEFKLNKNRKKLNKLIKSL